MRKPRLYNKRNTPLSLTFLGEDVTAVTDAIEDAKTADELRDNLNRLDLYVRFTIDRATDDYVRLVGKDSCGNLRYLKAWFDERPGSVMVNITDRSDIALINRLCKSYNLSAADLIHNLLDAVRDEVLREDEWF